MGHRFDEVARILAKPMPRRDTWKLLAGVLLGGVFAGRADAQTCRPACRNGQTCCGRQKDDDDDNRDGHAQASCVPAGRACCGGTTCDRGDKCCTGPTGRKFCREENDNCCGNGSCPKNRTCCNNSVCCSPNQACVNGRCAASKG